MIFHFKNKFPKLETYWQKYLPFQRVLEVPEKTIILKEGQISQNYIYIKKGSVRAFILDKNGIERSIQFFFENEGLASFDSFVNETQSPFTIETMEPSTLYLLPKKETLQLIEDLKNEADFTIMILKMSAQRQTHYMNELISFIKDTPEQRYQNLVNQRPHIIQRVPQHYIASYLGISSVHISRIKNKLAKGKKHF